MSPNGFQVFNFPQPGIASQKKRFMVQSGSGDDPVRRITVCEIILDSQAS